MIYADNIIERNAIFLRNLNTNSNNTELGKWTNGLTGYGFYSVSYEYPLVYGHYYYQRFTYKFTTTNQSPTWSQMYLEGGMQGGPTINNPVANTEYTKSLVSTPARYAINSGTIYNGSSNAINGVTSYVKDVLIYDVTELYELLRSMQIATSTSTLQTWCDNNLIFVPKNTNYDITSLLSSADNNIQIHKGTIIANQFVEPDGMRAFSYSATLANNTWFDNGSGLSIYNNAGGGTVTHTRVSASAQNSPFAHLHPYVLKITTNGTASPGAGGFIATHVAGANKIFIEKFIAKVPKGYVVTAAYNPQGTGAKVSYLTPMNGTDDWEEYAILYQCGNGGSYSSGGHVYIQGSNNTSVTWYLAYVNNCDITNNPELKYYQVMKKGEKFYKGNVFTNEVNTRNIFPNGDCSSQSASMLPAGWIYDTEDKAGNAYASIVQPVNATAGTYGSFIPINPYARYKISMWIKSKQDMTSFLLAIIYYDDEGHEYSHGTTCYVNGTKTTLKSPLNKGDTSITVNSNANWVARSHSSLGFRKNQYNSDWNDYGTVRISTGSSSGLITGVSGTNIINLAEAYTGNSIPANQTVVESYDGGTYPYPIQKSQLPTDNTWKYVEGYFGGNGNTIYEGVGSWSGIPKNATKLKVRLNLYGNTGSVPIKFSDIRIEPINISNNHRREDKIQLKGGE